MWRVVCWFASVASAARDADTADVAAERHSPQPESDGSGGGVDAWRGALPLSPVVGAGVFTGRPCHLYRALVFPLMSGSSLAALTTVTGRRQPAFEGRAQSNALRAALARPAAPVLSASSRQGTVCRQGRDGTVTEWWDSRGPIDQPRQLPDRCDC